MKVEVPARCLGHPQAWRPAAGVLNAVTGYHHLQPLSRFPLCAGQVTRHPEIVTNSTGELTQHIVVLVQQR